MKKILFATVILSLSLVGFQAHAQTGTEEETPPQFPKVDTSPMDMAQAVNEDEEVIARIIYGRPSKRGREIFGSLVPYGEVWRTGANESTELTLYQDMRVGGKTIEEGTYTFYTIPEENEWTIILNRTINTWGAYDYHVENDLARIRVPVRRLEHPLETLSMVFEPAEDGTLLKIGWDDRYVQVPFKTAEK